jgi:hypothetical protein
MQITPAEHLSSHQDGQDAVLDQPSSLPAGLSSLISLQGDHHQQ